MNNYDISIVIPVYNNGNNLAKLENGIKISLSEKNISYEIIFINDFSTDNSKSVIDYLTRNDNIKLINNTKNIGQHKSILKGLLLCNGKNILIMDADLQDNPIYIQEMYFALKHPYKVVFALREGKYQERSKLITSFLLKSITEFLSGLNKKAGTFFIITNEVKEDVLKLKCKSPYITYMVASICKNKIGYISTVRDKRSIGISAYSTFKRIKAGLIGIACIIECKTKLFFINKQIYHNQKPVY